MAQREKQTDGSRWLGIAVTIIVVLCSAAGTVAWTRAGVETLKSDVDKKASVESVAALKADVERKADKAVVETELRYIRQGVDEIKAELRKQRTDK